MTTALRFGIACAPFPGIRIGSVLPVMSLRISASSNSVAIAPADELNAPATKRHAKIDYNLFMVRCSEAIRKARIEGAKKHSFVAATHGRPDLSSSPSSSSIGGLSSEEGS